MSEIRIVEEELRYKFYHRDQFCLAYNKGSRRYGDFYLSRPNFYPVYSPSGRQATTSSAYRFNHHKSIFLGHGTVNGINFFHDNNPTKDNLGDIAIEEAQWETTEASAILRTRNLWVTKAGVSMLKETRDISWTPGDQTHVLDVSSALVSLVGDVTFGRDTHSYFGVRVADTIDVEDGGRAINSKGDENEEGAMDQFADWLDYSGEVAGKTIGVTLIHHPANPPSPYFVRNYGTFLSNFTLRGPYLMKASETLTQRFRVLVHEGGPDEVDIARYQREFADS